MEGFWETRLQTQRCSSRDIADKRSISFVVLGKSSSDTLSIAYIVRLIPDCHETTAFLMAAARSFVYGWKTGYSTLQYGKLATPASIVGVNCVTNNIRMRHWPCCVVAWARLYNEGKTAMEISRRKANHPSCTAKLESDDGNYKNDYKMNIVAFRGTSIVCTLYY